MVTIELDQFQGVDRVFMYHAKKPILKDDTTHLTFQVFRILSKVLVNCI